MGFISKINAYYKVQAQDETSSQVFCKELAKKLKEDFSHVEVKEDGSGEVKCSGFLVKWKPSLNEGGVWLNVTDVAPVKAVLDADRILAALNKFEDQMKTIFDDIAL